MVVKVKNSQLTDKVKKRTKTFIEKSKAKFGNAFDYTDTVYTGTLKPVTVKCKTCKTKLTLLAYSHLTGNGCSECSARKRKRTNLARASYEARRENFFKKLEAKFPNQFDCSKTEYVNMNGLVTVMCKKCKRELTVAAINLISSGCQECKAEHNEEGKRKTRSEIFFEKAKDRFGEKFDFTNSVYKGIDQPVIFKCNDCKSYHTIIAKSILNLNGCSYCNGRKKLKGNEGKPVEKRIYRVLPVT